MQPHENWQNPLSKRADLYSLASVMTCCCTSDLTFDMRGGRQQAKPDVGRPLDERVRAHSGQPFCVHCKYCLSTSLRCLVNDSRQE